MDFWRSAARTSKILKVRNEVIAKSINILLLLLLLLLLYHNSTAGYSDISIGLVEAWTLTNQEERYLRVLSAEY